MIRDLFQARRGGRHTPTLFNLEGGIRPLFHPRGRHTSYLEMEIQCIYHFCLSWRLGQILSSLNKRVDTTPPTGAYKGGAVVLLPPWDLWAKVETNKQTDKLNVYIDTKLLYIDIVLELGLQWAT